MSLRARATVLCLGLSLVSCGGERTPPTGPSAPGQPVSLSISGAAASFGVGDSQRLQAIVRFADGTSAPASPPVVWRSSNEAVLSAWADGLIVGLSAGPATITATAANLSASSTVNVLRNDGVRRLVQGRVLDFASQAGVPGVPVVFTSIATGVGVTAAETVTDAAGNYAVGLPAGDNSVTAGDQYGGVLSVLVSGPAFHGDFYVNGGACIARYGFVIDAATYRPVVGATVTYGGGTAVTSAEGYYRIDHPCVGTVSGNTITVQASHPDYARGTRFSGRGLGNVVRLDFALQRP